jgi:hypothetical protein
MACSLLSRPPCANCERENDSEICEVSPCLNEALLTCDGCYLVQVSQSRFEFGGVSTLEFTKIQI